MRCLVTGATGYVGGRLVPRLLAAGHEVRCVVRDPAKLRDVPWSGDVQIVRGDVLDADSMSEACREVDVLYYLVHSLRSDEFGDRDRDAARVTSEAAAARGVSRVVYLGGLHPEGELSEHLRSRVDVARIFLDGTVSAVVLQAAVIIGSGSASFEMLRHLTERLPLMVTPSWVRNRVQPIAIRDVLHYLVAVASLPGTVNRTFDIGGPEVLTYADMMRRYATVAGLPPRFMLPVKVLSPTLSAYWINIVTPVPRAIGAPLIESLVHEAVCHGRDIDALVPPPAYGRTSYGRAVSLALSRTRRGEVDTRWSDATRLASDPLPTDPDWAGSSVYVDTRRRRSSAPTERVWDVIESIGGQHGWYSFPLAWAVRGWADRLAGGVGLRRGRRDPTTLRTGEALDWWRVESLAPGRMLRLRAEMKVPGRAWLELGVLPDGHGGAIYHQRAVFLPSGLAGHLYWWAIAPWHGVVFGGMTRNIVRRAERAR